MRVHEIADVAGRPTRVLTVCSVGAVRSVGMAYILKQIYGEDAVPLGASVNTPETFSVLSDWADLILVMQPMYAEAIPERNQSKIVIADVGPDVWANPLHRELLGKVMIIAQDLFEKGKIKKNF